MRKRSCFEVGQCVETRSFLKGYRGAWFRCMIEDFDDGSRCLLKYLDYKDEDNHWTKEFQVDPSQPRRQSKIYHHMLRPLPPPVVYKEDFSAKNYKEGDQVLVFDPSALRVGDIVDMRHSDCWWRGIITSITNKATFKISLPGYPEGEGGLYTTTMDKMRPALEWCEEDGWILAVSKSQTTPRIGELRTITRCGQGTGHLKSGEQMKMVPSWAELRALVKLCSEQFHASPSKKRTKKTQHEVLS